MDGFSVASLSSLCSAISHTAIAGVIEIAELVAKIPPSHHADQLASLSRALQEFSESVSRFEVTVNGAPAISPRLQGQLGASLGVCQGKLAPLGKQVMRLQPTTVGSLNAMYVMVNEDLLLAYTQLLAFFEEVLAMTVREDQDATLDGPQGRRIMEQTEEAGRMISKAGEIMVNPSHSGLVYSPPNAPPADPDSDQPPPYSYEPSGAGPSTAPAAPDNTWGSALSQSFRALTASLRARPDPLVSALCEASRRGDVGQAVALLKQGAKIDGRNDDGETPLHCAILANQEAVARLLLASGADDNQWSTMPPMFLAASVGNIDVARMIYDRGGPGANVKRQSMSGNSYLVDVVESGNLDGVRFLLERGASAKTKSISGRHIIVQAARRGDVDMVRLLLDFGAKVNSDDITGNSLLSIALDKEDMGLMDLLISRGAKVNSRMNTGERILSAAISRRNMAAVRSLIEAGADGNIDDMYGQKVIVRVVRDDKVSSDEKVELVQLLLKNGAKAQTKDSSWPNMKLLPTAVDKGVDGRVIAMLMQHGADSKKLLSSGETPLTHAIGAGRVDQVEALLKNGADANLPNRLGKLPLMQALIREDVDVVRLLVEHGAHVEPTALEYPMTLGRPDLLQVLGVPRGVSSGRNAPPGYDVVPGKV